MLDNIPFIKPNVPFVREFEEQNYAPMFRRCFDLQSISDAHLYVCTLGIGYVYINGQPISDDLFIAPVSDYTKTLWYNEYDVAHLLKKGKNVVSVWCGNGFYNEPFKTDWGHNNAKWRDVPKFALRLEIGNETVLASDEKWKCKAKTAVYFNALRSGERFDARLYDEHWTDVDYDDSDWQFVKIDDTPPAGVFRKCFCEPIRECSVYKPINIERTSKGKYIYDIGQNISGYIRLNVTGLSGQQITIRYAEQINDDLSLKLNNMDTYYPQSEFQTDKFICNGNRVTWSPKFAYHGFRYIEIDGVSSDKDIEVEGIFVHQDILKKTEFECSNKFLNDLFKAGEISVYSNMFYMITDCPTREKLGWTNDAQSSARQMLINFKSEKLLEKWLFDIYDAMREDGSLPGIVPTPGWGYEWGNGPVSDGALLEIPYRIYLQTGNPEPLKRSLPYFNKYFNYLDSRREDGFIRFGLSDWAGPGFLENWENPDVPCEIVNAILEYGFYEKAALAASLAGFNSEEYKKRQIKIKELIKNTYITKDGECKVDKQTPVAMIICFKLFEDIEALKVQLKRLVEEKNFRHDCGMVGMRYLLWALNQCGLEEYAYKIVAGKGFPGYSEWFENGATTLWEYWEWQKNSDSKNHHMFSDVLAWMLETVCGISVNFERVEINPFFFKELDYAKAVHVTDYGKICVEWQRKEDEISLCLDIPHQIDVYYKGNKLQSGVNSIVIKEQQ